MSITTIHDLFCDGDECLSMFPFEVTTDKTPGDVRRRAKRCGWDRVDGRDRCSACVRRASSVSAQAEAQ